MLPDAEQQDGVDRQSMRDDPTLHLPRILCLHGGGTNSRIFRAQCRIIRRHLEPYFRLVFADAPYVSNPGPDVESVFAEWAPFRSWLRPEPKQSHSLQTYAPGFVVVPVADYAADTVIKDIEESISAAIREDNNAGASGDFVGLLGFSQGAKMAASLLSREQKRMEMGHRQNQIQYRFAVLMAGRAPLVSLNPDFQSLSDLHDMADEYVLRLPTVHVHGIHDGGLEMHRDMLNRCCAEGSTVLVEWDGDHRVPIKAKDVSVVVAEILHTARQTCIGEPGWDLMV